MLPALTLLSSLAMPWVAPQMAHPRASHSWVLGKVLDRAGRAVAGAEIFYREDPGLTLAGQGTTPARRTRTNRRGLFRIAIRRDGHPLIGARWKMADGRWGLSRTQKIPARGQPLLLHEVRAVAEIRILPLRGLAAWKGKIDFRFRMRDDFGQTWPVSMDGPSTLRVPCMPGGNDLIEMTTAKGRVLRRFLIADGEMDRGIDIPSPILIRVLAIDRQSGQPVSGARIHRVGPRFWTRQAPIAVTDPEGRASFWSAAPMRKWSARGREFLFCVLAEGHQRSVFGWNSRWKEASARIDRANVSEPLPLRQLELDRQPSSRGRLSSTNQDDWKGIDIRLQAELNLANTWYHPLPGFDVRGQNGAYSLPFSLTPRDRLSIELILTPPALESLGRTNRAWLALSDRQRIIHIQGSGAGRSLPALDLRRLRLFRIHALRSNLQPAPHARVFHLDPFDTQPQIPRAWTLDRDGSWQAPIWGWIPPLLVLHHGQYRILGSRDLGVGHRAGERFTLEARLRPMRSLTLQLVDTDGRRLKPESYSLVPAAHPKVRPARLLAIQQEQLPIRVDADGLGRLTYLPELAPIVESARWKIAIREKETLHYWSIPPSKTARRGSRLVLILDPSAALQAKRKAWKRMTLPGQMKPVPSCIQVVK